MAQVPVDDRGVLVNVVDVCHSRRVVSVWGWIPDAKRTSKSLPLCAEPAVHAHIRKMFWHSLAQQSTHGLTQLLRFGGIEEPAEDDVPVLDEMPHLLQSTAATKTHFLSGDSHIVQDDRGQCKTDQSSI